MEAQDIAAFETRFMHPDASDLVRQLTGELENFEEIAKCLIPQPGDVPKLRGIDIHGGTLPLNGVVGGDHVIYVDFKERFDVFAARAEVVRRRAPRPGSGTRGRAGPANFVIVAGAGGHVRTDQTARSAGTPHPSPGPGHPVDW